MLEILIDLFLSFFKIGLFGFGGGYAMISLIQNELISHSWMSIEDFINIIAIAEMTPGPIAINSGTFVGYKISRLPGSIIATVAVIVPSFILVLLLAHYYERIRNSRYIKILLLYLRPAVIALILGAAISIARTNVVDIKSIIIVLGVLVLMRRTNVHPITVIILAGLSGALIYA